VQKQKIVDLQVGDEVAIQAGMSDNYTIYQITKIGPRGIIEISTGAKYRPDGSPVAKGDKWHYPEPIQMVTDTIRQTIRKQRLVTILNGLNYNDWKEMDLPTLEAVNALVSGNPTAEAIAREALEHCKNVTETHPDIHYHICLKALRKIAGEEENH